MCSDLLGQWRGHCQRYQWLAHNPRSASSQSPFERDMRGYPGNGHIEFLLVLWTLQNPVFSEGAACS